MYISNNILLLPVCFFGLYFILEAMDWGLCIASSFICKSDDERKVILKLLRPGIDGNELWFLLGITALIFFVDSVYNLNESTKILTGIIILGCIIRFIFSLGIDIFKNKTSCRLMTLFSIISLFFIGCYSFMPLYEESYLLSLVGVLSSFWMIFSCFQIGCIYGAVKTVNPLSERFRAGYLVSSLVSVFVYLIFSFFLKSYFDDNAINSGYYWIGLVSTLIFYVLSFYFVRSRNVKVGLVFAYFYLICSLSTYFITYVSKFSCWKILNVILIKKELVNLHILEILLITVIWTFVSFIYKLVRKKLIYKWNDYI